MRRRITSLLLVFALVGIACGTRASEEQFELLMGEGADTGPTAAQEGTAGPATVLGDGDGPDTTRTAGANVADQRSATTDGSPDSQSSTDGDNQAGQADDGPDAAETGASGGGSQSSGNSQDQGDARAANEASDVGVTEDTITVGNIVSLSGPLGANAFGPMYYGANAYFEYVNAQGGVHGRTIEFVHCDDAEDGGRNQECAETLVEDEQVFAFVANATRAYAGAEYVSNNGVPDILGQPIGNEYWTYPGFFSVRGSDYDNDGEVGYKGKLYYSEQEFQYFEQTVGVSKASVVYYSIPVSKVTGQAYAQGMRNAGIEVREHEVNPALPNFDAVVAQMQDFGSQLIYETTDINASRNLCQAMDRNGFQVKAKVSTSQGMSREVGSFSTPCRFSMHAAAEAVPYSSPKAETFRRVMRQVYGDRFADSLAQWTWEGWLAARSFTEAVRSMGATPTREKLIRFYEQAERYTLGERFVPLRWTAVDFDNTPRSRACIVIANWSRSASDFQAITEYPMCQQVAFQAYSPA